MCWKRTIVIFISVNITDVFAFENKERNGDVRLNVKKRGWDRFDWVVEFTRQGIGIADDQNWKITDFNMGYKVNCRYSRYFFLFGELL